MGWNFGIFSRKQRRLGSGSMCAAGLGELGVSFNAEWQSRNLRVSPMTSGACMYFRLLLNLVFLELLFLNITAEN